MRAIARHRLLAALAALALLTMGCEDDTPPPEDPGVIEDPDATDPTPAEDDAEAVGDEALDDAEDPVDAEDDAADG